MEVEDEKNHGLVQEELRESNGDEVYQVVMENKYKVDIKYEYLEKSPGEGDVDKEGYVGVAREEIRLWVFAALNKLVVANQKCKNPRHLLDQTKVVNCVVMKM